MPGSPRTSIRRALSATRPSPPPKRVASSPKPMSPECSRFCARSNPCLYPARVETKRLQTLDKTGPQKLQRPLYVDPHGNVDGRRPPIDQQRPRIRLLSEVHIDRDPLDGEEIGIDRQQHHAWIVQRPAPHAVLQIGGQRLPGNLAMRR